MKHFTIEYDHDTEKIVSMVQFDTAQEAVNRKLDLDLLLLPDGSVEVMTFEATSLAALSAACPQYFGWVARG